MMLEMILLFMLSCKLDVHRPEFLVHVCSNKSEKNSHSSKGSSINKPEDGIVRISVPAEMSCRDCQTNIGDENKPEYDYKCHVVP